MGLARHLLLRGSESRWLGERLAHRPFVHRAVRRFMPGEELDDAIAAAHGLATGNLSTILTLLGENVDSAAEAGDVAAAYVMAVQAVSALGLDTDLSVKATHLGLDLGEQIAFDNLDRLIAEASEADRLVALDMEATGYVNRTLDLYRALRERHQNFGICLQAYLYRTEKDLDSLLLLEARRSDPEIRVAFGTHDERMISSLIRRVDELGLPPDACEFQMLYGIGRELQLRLAGTGCACS